MRFVFWVTPILYIVLGVFSIVCTILTVSWPPTNSRQALGAGLAIPSGIGLIVLGAVLFSGWWPRKRRP